MTLEQFIKKHEGFRSRIYKDSKGHATIGYGFNLEDPFIRSLIPLDVRLGRRSLTKKEADRIFPKVVMRAKRDAVKYAGGKVFNSLKPHQQMVLIDMAYNLGLTKLNGFKEMKKALVKGDIRKAAYEMRNSDWYHQVGNRSKEDIMLFLSGGDYQQDKTFNDAFREARQKGLRVFKWNGKLYNTKLRGEE